MRQSQQAVLPGVRLLLRLLHRRQVLLRPRQRALQCHDVYPHLPAGSISRERLPLPVPGDRTSSGPNRLSVHEQQHLRRRRDRLLRGDIARLPLRQHHQRQPGLFRLLRLPGDPLRHRGRLPRQPRVRNLVRLRSAVLRPRLRRPECGALLRRSDPRPLRRPRVLTPAQVLTSEPQSPQTT
jgi:hypothetical protein